MRVNLPGLDTDARGLQFCLNEATRKGPVSRYLALPSYPVVLVTAGENVMTAGVFQF